MAINPNPPLKGYTELRRDLMHLADELNKKRLEMIEVQKMISECTLQLTIASDKLFTRSLVERTADGELKKEFRTEGSPNKDPEPDTNVQAVVEYLMPSKRNCSQCGKPGHRAPNCPDAHTIQQEKKEVATIKQNRETLAAANKLAGKRACSNCHKPGHRAKNCTEPVVVKRRRGKK